MPRVAATEPAVVGETDAMHEEPQPEAPPQTPPRTPPGAMMRFLVVVFGVLLFGLGRAIASAGGVVGVVLGFVIQLVGVAIVVIAIGLVEWVQRRRRTG